MGKLAKLGVLLLTIALLFIGFKIIKVDIIENKVSWTSIGTIFLSVIAIIPLIHSAIIKLKIEIYLKSMILRYNTRGNTFMLDFAVESNNEKCILKNVEISIKNLNQSIEKNFEWYSLESYNAQFIGEEFVGNYAYVQPAYLLEKDSVCCFKAVFICADEIYNFNNIFNDNEEAYEDIQNKFNASDNKLVNNLYSITREHKEYNNLKKSFDNLIFWTNGKYELEILLKINNSDYSKKVKFEILNDDYLKLKKNTEKIVMSKLNKIYCNKESGVNFEKNVLYDIISINLINDGVR